MRKDLPVSLSAYCTSQISYREEAIHVSGIQCSESFMYAVIHSKCICRSVLNVWQFQVCGKAFSNANDLTRHGKCHLGGSMFTCTVCFHVFANAPSLERHMKRHATDKPYNCTVCGKSFARKEHLDNHTRCHTGETPYRYVFVHLHDLSTCQIQ